MDAPKSLLSLTAASLSRTLPAECLDSLRVALPQAKVYLVFLTEEYGPFPLNGAFSSRARAEAAVQRILDRVREIGNQYNGILHKEDLPIDEFWVDPTLPLNTVYMCIPRTTSYGTIRPLVSTSKEELDRIKKMWASPHETYPQEEEWVVDDEQPLMTAIGDRGYFESPDFDDDSGQIGP